MKDNGGDTESTVVPTNPTFDVPTNRDNSLKMELENSEAVDIDTDLLCPDIIMEIRSEPIIGNEPKQDGSSSSTFSPYDYNITGSKAQFELNTVEEHLRNAIYGLDPDCVKYSKIHCTACNVHLGSALDNLENVFVHPILSVLVCKDCLEYYSNGTFEKDDDGSERFCRWCGQGGGVLCCSVCPMVFCKLCIRINFGVYKCSQIGKNDDWRCFNCEPHQLIALKVQCYEYARYVQTKMCISDSETADYYMKTDFALCCSSAKRRKRKNSSEEDPDYDPNVKRESEEEFPAHRSVAENEKKSILPSETKTKIEAVEIAVTHVTEAGNKKLKMNVVDAKHRVALIGRNNLESKFSRVPPQTDVVTDVSIAQKSVSQPTTVSRETAVPTTPSLLKPSRPLPKLPQKSGDSTATRNPRPGADENVSREAIGKAILDAALANGAFGSSIVRLERARAKAGSERPADRLALYNSCHEAVSQMIGQLLDVKRGHILANVRPGRWLTLSTIRDRTGFENRETCLSNVLFFDVCGIVTFGLELK